MENIVDCRGLACPEPVVMTKKALDKMEKGELLTIVDNETALKNVTRLAAKEGLAYQVEDLVESFHIHITKSPMPETRASKRQGSIAVLITSNVMGKGSEELGAMLIKSFIYTLTQMEDNIKSVIFMNAGVYLTTEGSEALAHLQSLEQRGVEILSCGTCLDYFGLKDKLAVGEASNMYTLTEQMIEAASVICL